MENPSSDKIRLGFWTPVYGNWIISKDPDTMDASFEYTKRLTLLAEELGFATVLLAEHTFNPFGPELNQQDAWTTSAALAAITKNIELMPAVRPAFKHPATVAKMACSIDEISGGRASLNLVTGWWQREWEAMGLPPMPHDDRYVRSEEFLTILKGLWTQPHFSFEGRYYQIDDITLTPPSIRKPHPTIYLGGESDMAQRLAAKLADVFIINGRPVEETKVLIDQVRAYAAEEGREVQFGISAFVICRDSMAAAQEEHARLHSLRCEDWIAGVDTKVVSLQTYGYAPGHVGTNGGTAAGTEGTPQQVADQFRAFQNIGVTTFLLQFHPMLEEMERFGEDVMPRLYG